MAITPKSEDKYVEKCSTAQSFIRTEMSTYRIGTLNHSIRKSKQDDDATVREFVCIDNQGFLKKENEKWTHRESRPGGSCAHCICENHQIHCQIAKC